ncbi:MAG: hypothetical protein AB7F59_05590 [Bdellovibrionales bacterium]
MMWLLLTLLIFIGAVGAYNFHLYSHFCQHTYDLGIFLEAFKKLSFADWNPYISTRQITILQDHWEPILVLLSPLARFFSLPGFGFGVEIAFFILAGLSLYLSARDQSSQKRDLAICLAILFLLHRETFEAVFYPIHPSTWAVFPLMLAGLFIPTLMPNQLGKHVSLQKEPFYTQFVRLLAIVILLNLFNEQYSLAALGLVLGAFLFLPRRLPTLLVLPFSLAFVWWAFQGRSSIVGQMFHHTDRLKLNPLLLLQSYNWDLPQFKTLLLFFLGFAPLIFFLIKSIPHWNRNHLRHFGVWLGLFSPLILGRLLSGSFGLHYNVILVVAAIVLFFLLIDVKEWPKKSIASWIFAFAILMSLGKWGKVYATVIQDKMPNCMRIDTSSGNHFTNVSNRQKKLNHIYDLISLESGPTKVLALGNLVPTLLSIPHAEVFHLGAFQITNSESFDWLVVERGVYGNHNGVPPEKLEALIKNLKFRPELQIISDDATLFVVKGSLPKSLFRGFFYDQRYNPVE